MQPDKIRILIVGDRAIVRACLRSFLGTVAGMEVVDEASNVQEAVEAACLLQPDVVLMDVGMPGMNGPQTMREMKTRAPTARVVVLTTHGTEEYLFTMLEAGASAYILKEAAPHELVSAVRTAYLGGVFVSPTVAKSLLVGHMKRPDISSDGGLTSREAEILRLLAQGHTNREIGDSLCLSVKTVEKHRAGIMDKLGLQSRSELVTYALQKGLIF